MAERIKDRTLVDDRVTYDYSTPNLDVVARPVDSYHPNDGSNAGQLINALGLMQSGMQAYGVYRDQKNERDREAGMVTRAKSPETPTERKSKAFIEGWEKLDGELKAKQDYLKEVNDFITQNSGVLTPDEINQGLADISKKYTAGATKNFLKGFITPALDIENQAKASYAKFQSQKLKEDTLINTNSMVGIDVPQMFLESSKKFLPGNYTLEDIQTNPDLAMAFYSDKNQQAIAADLAPKFRKYLDDKMTQFKALGLSKKEISALVLANVGDLAEQTGMTELLDYTTIKDMTGISVEDSDLKGDIETYKNNARIAKDRILSDVNGLIKHNTNVTFSKKVIDYTGQLWGLNPAQNPKDRIAIKAIFDKMEKDPVIQDSLEDGTVRALYAYAESKFLLEPKDEDQDKYYLTPIYTKYVKGTLNRDDILNVMSKVSNSGQSKLKGLWDDISDPSKANSVLKMNLPDSKWYGQIMQGVTSYATFNLKTADRVSFIAEMGNVAMERYLEIKRTKGKVTVQDKEDIQKELDQLLNPLPNVKPPVDNSKPSTPNNPKTPTTTTTPKSIVSTTLSKDRKFKKIVYSDGTWEVVNN
jgi:hypothetical protein